MTKSFISDLSTTAGSNTDLAGVGVAGSNLVSQGDNAFRSLAAMLAQFYEDLGGLGTVGGTGDAITLTAKEAWTAYGTGDGQINNGTILAFKAGAANTGAVTINVNAIGTKAIQAQGDTALGAGALVANAVYLLRYDTAYNAAAGAWVLLNPVPAAAPSSASTTVQGIVELATAAEWRTGTDTARALVVDQTWAAAAWVSIGASLSGNLTIDFATGFNFYGTATGAITFNAVSNAKEQSGEIMITASGGDRTVSFNTTPYATPNNASLGTITSGTTMLFSYTRAQNGKFVISAIGTVS